MLSDAAMVLSAIAAQGRSAPPDPDSVNMSEEVTTLSRTRRRRQTVRATRLIDDLPPSRTWWPERVTPPQALPGEPYQPALFPVQAPTRARRRPSRDPVRLPPGTMHVSRVADVPDATLPDVRRWALTLGVAMVEVLLGHRHLGQLVRHVSEEVQGTIRLAARSATPAERDRIVVESARIQLVSRRVVEACLRTRQGSRWVLVAFRLVAEDGKWLCTELDLLTPQGLNRSSRPAQV